MPSHNTRSPYHRLHVSDPREQRFLDDLISLNDDTPDGRTNAEAYALFLAIERAFSDWGDEPLGDPYLVHHLAACAWVAMEYDHNVWVPWDEADRDFIILRTLRGFMRTVAAAIRKGTITNGEDGAVYIGACTIPPWFIEEVKEAQRIEEKDALSYTSMVLKRQNKKQRKAS